MANSLDFDVEGVVGAVFGGREEEVRRDVGRGRASVREGGEGGGKCSWRERGREGGRERTVSQQRQPTALWEFARRECACENTSLEKKGSRASEVF